MLPVIRDPLSDPWPVMLSGGSPACARAPPQDDVQMLSHQILVKLCNHAPVQVLSSLELLVEPLDKTVNKKVKDSQVGTEVERANDLIRSGLRAIVAVVAIEEETAGNAHKFLERLQKKEKLAAMLQAIDAESLAV